MEPLRIRWLGRVGYARALELQESLVRARRANEVPDVLLLLEHEPVVTLGRRSDRGNLLIEPDELGRRGIEVHETGRGGDVTYHGPGQLVGYPVVRLPPQRRDAHRYLRDLEQALIRTAASYSLTATRIPGLTGVWAGGAKLAAIGVRLNSGWITSHGFALNVATDLSQFETIVPCGIHDRGVTSLEQLLGGAPPMRVVAARVASYVGFALGLRPIPAEDPAERLSRIEDEPVSWPRPDDVEGADP